MQVLQPIKTTAHHIRAYCDRHGHAPFQLGEGRISGYISAALGLMSLATVFCFLFPELLTTAEFRQAYSERFARTALVIALTISITLGMLNFLRNKRKRLGATGVAASTIAVLLGGATIPFNEPRETFLSLGMDWFLLSLLISALLFIPLERVFARRPDQQILRPRWRTDLAYYFLSHILVQFILIIAVSSSSFLIGWSISPVLQQLVQSTPLIAQILMAVFLADLAQYLIHRTYHEVEWLWRFHAVHHSSEAMDWLAGSRMHLVETMATRSVVMMPLLWMGFSVEAITAYAIWVGIQAVVSHMNIRLDIPGLNFLLVLPRYHHWHHAADPAYADKNFAVHFPFIDMLFGSFKLPPQGWPEEYGVFGEPLPENIVGQHLYPFTRSGSDYDSKRGAEKADQAGSESNSRSTFVAPQTQAAMIRPAPPTKGKSIDIEKFKAT